MADGLSFKGMQLNSNPSIFKKQSEEALTLTDRSTRKKKTSSRKRNHRYKSSVLSPNRKRYEEAAIFEKPPKSKNVKIPNFKKSQSFKNHKSKSSEQKKEVFNFNMLPAGTVSLKKYSGDEYLSKSELFSPRNMF